MKHTTNDQREWIIKLNQNGISQKETSRLLGLCSHTVNRICKRFKTTGSSKKKKCGGHRTHKLLPYKVEIIQWLDENQVLTLDQIKDKLFTIHKVKVGTSTISRFIYFIEYSFKKKY
jgi:transposase